MLDRYWINQPSNAQPLHNLHGTRVMVLILMLNELIIGMV